MTPRKYHVTLHQTTEYVYEVTASSAKQAREIAKGQLYQGFLNWVSSARRVGDITTKKTKAL